MAPHPALLAVRGTFEEGFTMIDRRTFVGLSFSALAAGLAACSSSNQTEATSTSTEEPAETTETAESTTADDNASGVSGLHHATITVKDKGVIKVELDADQAPITVANFMKLANEGFYNGLTFHRIISGFMIQGGDPNGNGTGGSSETIKGEFYANGVKNTIPHMRGTISMARSSDYNSASSQFFIVHKDSMDSLDGQYAAFGTVTEGMDVVDDLAENTPVQDSNGTVAPEDQPVIESIVIDD